MRFFPLAVLVCVSASLVAGRTLQQSSKPRRYDNYAVYKLNYNSLLQRRLLLKLAEQTENFQLWHESTEEIHLMVHPKVAAKFEQQMRSVNIAAELHIPNVQRLIDVETKTNLEASSEFAWKRYHDLNEIEAWLDGILADHANVTEGFVIGKSYEGRNIRGVKISYKAGNPGVFIESNIHAREWITSATATWLINELLTSTDEQIRALAEDHDWYIVPVLNVDGFVYTHAKDRLWRKTRQPAANSTCIGADANRNFDSHWMENEGASDNPCADRYAGPHAFSEPEVKALADYVASIKQKLNVLLAFHSFSQLLLSPYGHTAEVFPENYDDLQQVAKAYADAVEALPYGTVYKHGSTASLMYVASGSTVDWAYNEQDIKIAYTLEFRDTGRYGQVLPPAYIVPNAEETLIGIMALLAECQKLNYLQLKYN